METIIKKTTDTNAEETTNSESNSKLFEQFTIENTPFTAIKMDNTWFLTMGKYRLTNQLESLEECKLEAQDASWLRIMQIMKIMIKEHELEQALEKTMQIQKEKLNN